jgi:hypothetical protein
MKQTKTIIGYMFQPKVVIFGLALLNLLYIHFETVETGTGISFCYICPWYKTETFIHTPTLLLAALLLLISRWWSYIAAIAFSGHIVVYGSNLFITRPLTFAEQWRFIQEYEANILLQYEVQFILAVMIFIATVFYLTREIIRKNTLR